MPCFLAAAIPPALPPPRAPARRAGRHSLLHNAGALDGSIVFHLVDLLLLTLAAAPFLPFVALIIALAELDLAMVFYLLADVAHLAGVLLLFFFYNVILLPSSTPTRADHSATSAGSSRSSARSSSTSSACSFSPSALSPPLR